MSKKAIAPRYSSLPSFLKEHAQIDRVVDIGGGSGWIFNLLQPITQNPLTYFNIELKETCEEFSKEFSHTSRVQFVDSWESIVELKEISLVYSNSTMQYISDEVFFRNFTKLNPPKYVVFDDFIVTSSKSYWTLQNYYGHFIPYHFRNLTEFNLKLSELGYAVISVDDYRHNLAPGFSYGNEGLPQTIVYELRR